MATRNHEAQPVYIGTMQGAMKELGAVYVLAPATAD
jgi:hypothetical protein